MSAHRVKRRQFNGDATRSLLAFAAVLVFAGACGSAVNWKNHIAFRSTASKLEYATWEAKELVDTAISTNLHYVTVSIDSVFFRNLPGIGEADVALGFEITGVLGDGKAIKTVLDARKGQTENSFLNFDNLVVIDPFLYKGETVTINFHFTAVPGGDGAVIRARLQGAAGDALKRINPLKTIGVETGMNMFSEIFGFRAKSWQYSFTMFPADRIYRDKPDLLFAAGRHILMAIPPADAPAKFKQFKPHILHKKLKMRGNRLVDIVSDEDFTDLPYIVLNITRFKRYPKEDTELRKALKTIDAHIENGSLELAKSTLQGVGALINSDPVITSTEKNLERSLVRWRESRIEALLAKKAGAPENESVHVKKEIDQLFFTLKEFHKILEPFEVKDFLYRITEKIQRAEELAKETKEDPSWLEQPRKQYASLVKTVEEPPPPPTVAGPPIEVPGPLRGGTVEPESSSVFKKWWFWTAIGVVAAAGVALPIALKKTEIVQKGVPVSP